MVIRPFNDANDYIISQDAFIKILKGDFTVRTCVACGGAGREYWAGDGNLIPHSEWKNLPEDEQGVGECPDCSGVGNIVRVND